MLDPTQLATRLEQDWLVAEGGTFPGSTLESAQRFSVVVAQWLALATAGGLPCTTAIARQGQLMVLALAAFQAEEAADTAIALSLALSLYMTGQSFGAGVSAAPVATAAGRSAFLAAFGDLELDLGSRARQVAQGCHVMALSCIVAFPPPLTPAPIT